jgi:hypothetical protein
MTSVKINVIVPEIPTHFSAFLAHYLAKFDPKFVPFYELFKQFLSSGRDFSQFKARLCADLGRLEDLKESPSYQHFLTEHKDIIEGMVSDTHLDWCRGMFLPCLGRVFFGFLPLLFSFLVS